MNSDLRLMHSGSAVDDGVRQIKTDPAVSSPPRLIHNRNSTTDYDGQNHTHRPNETDVMKDEDLLEEELLLKWDDHHRSFFEVAEDLCHQEQFIDVTLSCGEHNFPAHKLVLSVCSPYFRHLFLRNPCKHPIVVLKDVHFKYMKLLLMYMYRGEVSCPQDDLAGLLRTARCLQIRGLLELERKREAERCLAEGSPLKTFSTDDTSTTSCEMESHTGDFSLDEVRHRLNGQLEIQPISAVPINELRSGRVNSSSNRSSSSTKGSTLWSSPHVNSVLVPPAVHGLSSSCSFSSNSSGCHPVSERTSSDDEHLLQRLKRGGSLDQIPGFGLHAPIAGPWGRSSPIALNNNGHYSGGARSRSHRSASINVTESSNSVSNSAASLLAAVQAAGGIPPNALDANNPMASMNALMAAAQAQSGCSVAVASTQSSSTFSNGLLNPPASVSRIGNSPKRLSSPHTPISSSNHHSYPVTSSTTTVSGGAAALNVSNENENIKLSQMTTRDASAMSNLQLYYYMQKYNSANATLGNPKERKECNICGKTLYDRSTWNRHMRIHTGEKPYPCRFCGRRFRTNYNKLGHEKKCPDRQPVIPTPTANANHQLLSTGNAVVKADLDPMTNNSTSFNFNGPKMDPVDA